MKKELLNKIEKTRDFRSLKQLPYVMIRDVYNARILHNKLSEKDFNGWLKTQTFYSGGLSLGLIAYILGVSRERVRQIEDGALKKLKHPEIGKKLKCY